MQAVVFTDRGEALRETAAPSPGEGEALVRVEYCGICGSDLHAAQPDFHVGTTMGHEFSATVLETGAGAGDWQAGDRAVVNPNGNFCGECEECRRGAPNLCPHLWEAAVGLTADGGLAPLAVVPVRVLRRIPDSLDFLTAAWTEPTAVALRTVRRSGLAVGEDAVVFGGGPIGLLVTAILARAGAERIAVVEPNPSRREKALALGATAAIDPFSTDVEAWFAEAGSPPRYAFECSGVASNVSLGIRVVRSNGRVMITGLSRTPPSFEAADLLFKEVEIVGSFIYRGEFEEAIRLLADGGIDVRSLTSGVVPFEDAAEAFAAMRESDSAIKYLISAYHAGEE